MKYILFVFLFLLGACYTTCPCRQNEQNLQLTFDGEVYLFKDGIAQNKDVILTDTGFSAYSKTKDKAFIFTMQSSGSGDFYYLTAVFKTKSGFVMAEPLFLGDRIQIQKIEWNKEGILVSYWDRLPSEPMSSKPSQLVSRLFIVKGHRLLDLI